MAAKVVWYREAWWIRTRWGGNKKKDRRIGPTKADKRLAEEIAQKINASLALGTFRFIRFDYILCYLRIKLFPNCNCT